MSWSLFKTNIKRRWDRPDTINNIDEVAELWANEYDAAIKRGRDSMHFITIQNGNKQGMQTFFRLGLQMGSLSNSPSFQLINEFGKGVVTYWTGATLQLAPIPVIPSTGAIQNIAAVANNVTLPGTWTPVPPVPPVSTTDVFIDTFITAATIHLTTVQGMVNTVSLYPGAPPVPGPGIVPWVGYTV
jgi:hypothetical protein